MVKNMYLGVKKIVLPDCNLSNNNLLMQCRRDVEPSTLIAAISLLKNKPVVVISDFYTENIPRDDFVGCEFSSGYLRDITEADMLYERALIFDNKRINLDEVVDIISLNHLSNGLNVSNAPENIALKLFRFNVADNTVDRYNLIHFDPILAYLDAEHNNGEPLKLARIQDLQPGMQFNYGKGQGKL